MPELKVEDAKKELEGILNKEKSVIQKSKEAQMSDEERKSLEAKQAEEKKKAEEAKIQAEAQSKKDTELLAKKDEEITDPEDKKRKAELLEKQHKDEDAKLSTDEKIKRIQESSQKRIDEVINELKEMKDKSSREAETLRSELAILRQEKEILEKKIAPAIKDDITSLVAKAEKERIEKYLQEDEDKPREERREMSRDELEEWSLEDDIAVKEWISERTLRRAQERSVDIRGQQKSKFVRELIGKQNESNKRVLVKHPDLDTTKREQELKSQGMSDDEIQDTLCKENEKYRISTEIVRENSSKYLTVENGPELVAAEMEKRLGKNQPPDSESQKKIDELTVQVETLTAKLEELVNPADEGITSTITVKARKTQLSEQEKLLVKTMQELKAPQTQIDVALKQFREKAEGKSA